MAAFAVVAILQFRDHCLTIGFRWPLLCSVRGCQVFFNCRYLLGMYVEYVYIYLYSWKWAGLYSFRAVGQNELY